MLLLVCSRQYLYGAVLDKGRSAVASAKPAKQAGAIPGRYNIIAIYKSWNSVNSGSVKCIKYYIYKLKALNVRVLIPWWIVSTVPAKAVVTRAKVNPKDLDNLIEEFNHFKSDTATELTRRNFVRHQYEQQQKMLGRVDENTTTNQEVLSSLSASLTTIVLYLFVIL